MGYIGGRHWSTAKLTVLAQYATLEIFQERSKAAGVLHQTFKQRLERVLFIDGNF